MSDVRLIVEESAKGFEGFERTNMLAIWPLRMKVGSRGAQHPAHRTDGVLASVEIDNPESHRLYLAKSGIAIFGTSCSWRTCTSSRCSRRTSSSPGLRLSCPGNAPSLSRSNPRHRLYRMLGWMPRSKVTSPGGTSLSSNSRTVSILNSRVYLFRLLISFRDLVCPSYLRPANQLAM